MANDIPAHIRAGARKHLERKHPHSRSWTSRLSLDSIEVQAWADFLSTINNPTNANKRKLQWCKALLDEISPGQYPPHDYDPDNPNEDLYSNEPLGPLLNPPHIEEWIFANSNI